MTFLNGRTLCEVDEVATGIGALAQDLAAGVNGGDGDHG
jgi:hypothetical protein